MLVYPDLDPVAFAAGPVKVHWYGIMYVVGFVAGWWLARRRAAMPGSTWKPIDVDDLIFFAAVGVIVGGRIGWMLVYGFDALRADPLAIIRVWQGGMSFHGGLVGVMVAIALFARRRGRRIADVYDFMAPLPAVGLFAGRIGNFINGELWGKPTDVPWAVVVDEKPLHATQLYEASLEGVLLFIILWWYTRKPRPRMAPTGLFLIIYSLSRITVEFWRVPDHHLNYLLGTSWITMGIVLSLPMLLIGLTLVFLAYRRRQPSGNFVAAPQPA